MLVIKSKEYLKKLINKSNIDVSTRIKALMGSIEIKRFEKRL